MNRRKLISVAGSILILLTIALFNFLEKSNLPTNSKNVSSTSYVVTRVVDGDTIEIETGQKVRYIGVNTPESVDPRKSVECFGKEASEKNKEFVLNKKVRLEKDVSEADRYGRLLRYVYLEDGTFVNLELIKQGYASAMTVPPDVARQSEFLNAQQQARESKIGLWSACE